MPNTPDIFKKDEFLETLEKEFKENILPTVLQEIINMGENHLRMLVGKKYEIKTDVDLKKLEGRITAPGTTSIKIEKTDRYFEKTFNVMINPEMISHRLRNRIKRITDKYLPSET